MAQPQAQIDTIHKFEDGKYIRELRVKAGIWLVGYHQRYSQMNKMISGKVMMWKDGQTFLLEAPLEFIGQPGQKVGYVVEDMVWQNIWVTDERDIDTLENIYFDKTPAVEYQAHHFALLSMNKNEDRLDYEEAIAELGFTEEEIQQQMLDTPVYDMPDGEYKCALGVSPIEGMGIIATANIMEGEEIGLMRVGNKKTIFGRYTNHSKNPNASIINTGNGLMLVAIANITGPMGSIQGNEITVDYRQVRAVASHLDKEE